MVDTKVAAQDRIKGLLWHGNALDAIDDIESLAAQVAADLEENRQRTLGESSRRRSLNLQPISPTTAVTP